MRTSALHICDDAEQRRECAVLTETPIITDILDEDVAEGNSIPQTSHVPGHRKLQARTDKGPLLLRISDEAAPKLVESLLAPRSGLDFSIPLRGSGPFNLPIVQSAKAHAGSDAVMLSLRIMAEPGRLVTVQIQIPNNQALQLAAGIARAVP
jgi:hypothetical protein